ncbi:hypothetical protein PIB30_002443 [Stylosanthes scabra]|uniref:Zinc finger GRF-type domain-containing protein n=1 Tax=Stylosanthes scabra TaxID=79078 RepID=A0ABU6W6C5_9FABA|nr:hypothetical protein [Stylosanthes scabra]
MAVTSVPMRRRGRDNDDVVASDDVCKRGRHVSWVRTSSGDKGSKVPPWCGLRPVLRWSSTEQNPDKPFYGCPKYNMGKKMKAWHGGHNLIPNRTK